MPDTEYVTHSQLDRTLGALANRSRRYALYHLVESDEDVVPFDALVSSVCERDADADADGDEVRIATRLHHCGLPAMEDAGFVEYDPASERVRYRPRNVAEQLVSRVRELESVDDSA